MAAILVVDDEPGIRQALSSILEDEKYRVLTAEDAVVALDLLGREKIDLILLDVLLPKLGGLEALERIRIGWPEKEVVMISGHANIDMAVRAVKGGAFDFLEKPLSLDKVLTVCRNALSIIKLREENRRLKKSAAFVHQEIIGTSDAISRVRDLVKQAASTDARILITGENGVGKEVVAKAVHSGSFRADRPFVELNCAAIPETLIESELFGHERGAFTDAVSSRKGRFELADGGTLFLDEIGDMSLPAQAKVLRVIQEQRMERLGGEKTITTDVRIIAASNKDLEKACVDGSFRQDLFFRLNVIPIHVPPLRERPGDILLLLGHFLKNRGMENFAFGDDAEELLLSHDWPGNVRELRNVAERIAVMYPSAEGGISKEELSALVGNTGKKDIFSTKPEFPPDILEHNYSEAKELFEKRYLEYHFSRNNGIISKTAEAIGIYPSNLHSKLKKYGIAAQNNTI